MPASSTSPIDEIFAAVLPSTLDNKVKKSGKKPPTKPQADFKPLRGKSDKLKRAETTGGFCAAPADGSSASSRKRTEEGLKIYTLEELNIGKGGDTALCPFDCKCCF